MSVSCRLHRRNDKFMHSLECHKQMTKLQRSWQRKGKLSSKKLCGKRADLYAGPLSSWSYASPLFPIPSTSSLQQFLPIPYLPISLIINNTFVCLSCLIYLLLSNKEKRNLNLHVAECASVFVYMNISNFPTVKEQK